MNTINKRIELIIKYLDMNKRDFALSISETPSWISNTTNITNPTKPEFERVAKIYLKYPQINPHWLLTGEGDMLEKNNAYQIGNVNNGTAGEMNYTYKNVADCEKEVEKLQMEIRYLKKEVADKEEIISLLKNK